MELQEGSLRGRLSDRQSMTAAINLSKVINNDSLIAGHMHRHWWSSGGTCFATTGLQRYSDNARNHFLSNRYKTALIKHQLVHASTRIIDGIQFAIISLCKRRDRIGAVNQLSERWRR